MAPFRSELSLLSHFNKLKTGGRAHLLEAKHLRGLLPKELSSQLPWQ